MQTTSAKVFKERFETQIFGEELTVNHKSTQKRVSMTYIDQSLVLREVLPNLLSP